ncbi:MAG: molybdopterin-dependent oxidoreductase [Nitrospiraceae bacterium]
MDRRPAHGPVTAGKLKGQALHVQLQGANQPAVSTVPLFVRSIPLEKAMHPDTLLAYEMNGRPLPLLHGAPMRVITPGWMAESCIKWRRKLPSSPPRLRGTTCRRPIGFR